MRAEEECGSSWLTGGGMGLAFHGNLSDDRGCQQTGFLGDLSKDRLLQVFTWLDSPRRNLGAGLRHTDVVEDQNFGDSAVPDDVRSDTDSGSGHPGIVSCSPGRTPATRWSHPPQHLNHQWVQPQATFRICEPAGFLLPVAARPRRAGYPPSAPRVGAAAGWSGRRRRTPPASPPTGSTGRLPLPRRPRQTGPPDDTGPPGRPGRGDARPPHLPHLPPRRRVLHPGLARHVRDLPRPSADPRGHPS